MTSAKQIEKALFETARNMADPEARKTLLDQACSGDPAMRIRLERLLAVQEPAEEFFNVRLLPSQMAEKIEGPPAPASAQPNGDSKLDSSGLDGLNLWIGRYKLLQRLGEGGCGVVYLAEQQEPMRRRVALKVIRLGMDTESVIARFEAERQALAMMDHPNIAHVLDAGAAENGRPYFVMELVRGVKITEYCNENNLDTRQRLGLFIQVCHAIQHAHQKGVIHRDIKPSNILVTLHDGAPVPKVIDFGIAKATAGRLTDNTIFTAYEQFIGTPAYMSPEQVEMSGMDVDTRSDIYSLGILLYELLTGRTPFDTKKLLQSGVESLRRTLRERDPQPPSTLLTNLNNTELTTVATHHCAQAPKLISSVRGDLDWIVMKALEKDRSRRYETANGLAMDVQRHLNNEPVVARPPGRLYRFQKLVRRHKVTFAATAAVAVTLIAGFGTSTWLFLEERGLRREAEKGRANENMLRQMAEARVKIAQAAVLMGEDRFDEADQLVTGIEFPAAVVQGETVFRSLGSWAAMQGQWKRAAQCFTMLMQVDQVETLDISSLDASRCAVALVEAGDQDGYERFRWAAIKQISTEVKVNDPIVAERTVKNSLLLPADEKVLSALAGLAEIAAKSMSEETKTAGEPWPGAKSWRCVSLALMEYRRGHSAEAIDWCKQCLAYGGENRVRMATIHAILAMCYYQLGQLDYARSELAQSRDLTIKSNGGLEMGDGKTGFWFDWALVRILLREAAGLVSDSTEDAAL